MLSYDLFGRDSVNLLTLCFISNRSFVSFEDNIVLFTIVCLRFCCNNRYHHKNILNFQKHFIFKQITQVYMCIYLKKIHRDTTVLEPISDICLPKKLKPTFQTFETSVYLAKCFCASCIKICRSTVGIKSSVICDLLSCQQMSTRTQSRYNHLR